MSTHQRPGRGGAPTGAFDRQLLSELPTLRLPVAGAVAAGLLGAAAMAAQAIALGRLIAGALPGSGAEGSRSVLLFVLVGATVVRAAVVPLRDLCAQASAASAKATLRERLLTTSLGSGGGEPGGLAALAGRGLDSLDEYVGRYLPDVALAALVPLLLLAVIGVLDWVSAVILLGVLVLFPLFGALVGRATTTLAAAQWAQVEQLGEATSDLFEGMATLRSFGRCPEYRQRLAESDRSLRGATVATLRVAFLSGLVLDTLGSISVALVAVPLGLRLLHGSIALAPALGALILAPEVSLPLRRASAEFHESAEGLAALDRIRAAVGSLGAPGSRRRTGAPSAAVPPLDRPTVLLRDVTVRAPEREAPLLDRVNLSIGAGETIGVVGENGAGKSTLLSLLLGFSAPVEGTVEVCGRDLRALDPEAWHRQVAYLPEFPSVLGMSLADNLRLANPGATDTQLCQALARIGAEPLLGRLPEGLGSPLGLGRWQLSAGERQRVGLARVLLRDAALYLLDEPTAHLDEEAEGLVIEALRTHLAGSMAVIVSHRPAVLALAQRVVQLQSGRLRELPTQEARPQSAPSPRPRLASLAGSR